MEEDLFQHPLNDGVKMVEIDGQQVETVNPWGLAEMIVQVLANPEPFVEKNPNALENALAMAKEACYESNSDINFDELLTHLRSGDEAASRQLCALIASGVEMKLESFFQADNE